MINLLLIVYQDVRSGAYAGGGGILRLFVQQG